MKRIIILLVVISVLFSGCGNSFEIKIGDNMDIVNDNYSPYLLLNSLYGYNINNNYVFIIVDCNIVKKLVEFSADRKVVSSYNLDLISSDDFNKYLGININKLIEVFNQPHVDIGSGFYLPSYITNDANLITFDFKDETVYGVTKRDLLTNRVEHIDYEGNSFIDPY